MGLQDHEAEATSALELARQPFVTHPAVVVHLSAPLALGDLDEQVRQRDVGAVDGDQLPLAVLPAPSALFA